MSLGSDNYQFYVQMVLLKDGLLNQSNFHRKYLGKALIFR